MLSRLAVCRNLDKSLLFTVAHTVGVEPADMLNVRVIIWIYLSLNPSLCEQLKVTEVPPTMEFYNGTHRKIYFNDSFLHLPERYVALLIDLKPVGELRIRRWKIVNDFIKLEPCEVKKGSLFLVQIFQDDFQNITGNTQPLTQSKEFEYNPGNNVIKKLNQTVCSVDNETVSVDIEAMKKNDKYFKHCFHKMKIQDVTITSDMTSGKAEPKDGIITVFFHKRKIPIFAENVKMEDLNVCRNTERYLYIGLGALIPIVLILIIGFILLYLRRRKSEKMFAVETNPVYGNAKYFDGDYKTSELKQGNDYYGSEYKVGSEVSDFNNRYNKQID